MNLTKNRQICLRFGRLATLTDISALLLFTLFLWHFLPVDLLRKTPASGGDTGSHFWPLYTLVNYGIPQQVFPVWNPGNNGGEPQLLHYFPLPFFFMAALSSILPLGMAFNFGTLVPLFCLPLCVYLCLRLMGLRFPAPILAAACVLPFLYNESFSMWGGNALSTLAGQFAHGYALCLLLLATGALCKEIRRDRFPFYATLLFAGVVLSHAYVAIAIPVILFAVACYYPFASRKQRASACLKVVAWLPLLTAWFVIPLMTNQRWTTAMPMTWPLPELLRGAIPPMLYPVFALLLAAIAVSRIYPQTRRGALPAMGILWGIPTIVYVALIFIFPKVGLVDIRAVPQIQLCLGILSGIYGGAVVRRISRTLALFTACFVAIVSLVWCNAHIEVLPHWLQYNYSGWAAKPGYQDLRALYTKLHGSFSDPRVLYEHSVTNELAGSLRVFEMLPYFANRATLESVYTQSTILAPATYLLQSEVSETPSCPLNGYSCDRPNVTAAKARMQLMGVSQFIGVDPNTIQLALGAPFLKQDGIFGPWHLFTMLQPPKLVELFTQLPGVSSNANWKEEFYNWFHNYDGSQRFLLAADFLDDAQREELEKGSGAATWSTAAGTCHPALVVSFRGLLLTTDCPGKAHLLKFAYHPSWRASTGDPLFLVSPGMLGIIPSESIVELSFGHSVLWTVARGLSAGGVLVFCAVSLLSCHRLRRKEHARATSAVPKAVATKTSPSTVQGATSATNDSTVGKSTGEPRPPYLH